MPVIRYARVREIVGSEYEIRIQHDVGSSVVQIPLEKIGHAKPDAILKLTIVSDDNPQVLKAVVMSEYDCICIPTDDPLLLEEVYRCIASLPRVHELYTEEDDDRYIIMINKPKGTISRLLANVAH